MAVVVRVKDRGRDLSTHRLDALDEAQEVRRVYELLGYAPEKIIVEEVEVENPQAA